MSRLELAIYYVALDVGGQPALFVRRRSGNDADRYIGPRSALADGVENMQLVFASDDRSALGVGGVDDNADTYKVASDVSGTYDDIAAWQRVIAVRVGVQLRSPSPSTAVAGAAPTPLRNADTVITPADDGRLRATYEAMIAIRNRVRN